MLRKFDKWCGKVAEKVAKDEAAKAAEKVAKDEAAKAAEKVAKMKRGRMLRRRKHRSRSEMLSYAREPMRFEKSWRRCRQVGQKGFRTRLQASYLKPPWLVRPRASSPH